MDFLAAATVLAGGKVLFVVPSHLRRQPGNVVPPARQYLAYDWINALLTHGGYEISQHADSTKAESAPEPLSGTPGARDYKTNRPARLTLVLPLSGLFPDGCSAQTDAPALQTSHYYHSRY